MIRKQPHRDRPDRSAEFASWSPRPRTPARMATRVDLAVVAPAPPKLAGRVQQAIRDSARGEACQVRLPMVCTFDPAKTIWSHAPLQAAGKGRGIKALDLCGAYCCTACDAAIDRQSALPPGLAREQVELAWHEGHMRSLVLLRQKGLV